MKAEGRRQKAESGAERHSGWIAGNRGLSFCLLPSAFCLLFLVANSAGFLFQQPYYEAWDLAANSLSIERAKHFAEWYGPYSRWGFHHPGPAYFYALAFGEWLFHDLLHLTPAPFNAQVLTQICVSTAFFGAALSVFARRLTQEARKWFWPLAIMAGALHFGFASRLPSYDFLQGPSAFTSTWSAHQIVMPFLCLLTAGASVASGNEEELPLLALSAGTLLHLHVAQPLFVLPLSSLAGAGLILARRRRDRDEVRPITQWRYVVTGLILAVFALPLLLDLFRGGDSNFAAIVHHLRTHHGEHKSLAKSLLYLVQFGAYTPYQPGRLDFGHFDGAGALAYLHGHMPILVFWLLTLLMVVGIIARGRFLKWEGWFLLTGIVLTLYWGIVQDGEMFYYNAWLNFALYYFGLLIVSAELSNQLSAQPLGRLAPLAPAAATVIVCALLADRWRVRDPIPETTILLHVSIQRVLAATPPRHDWVSNVPAFEFPEQEWPVAAALGLEMARAGRPFEVNNRWVGAFGRDHAMPCHPEPDSGNNAVPWRFQTDPGASPWRSDQPELLTHATEHLRTQLAMGPVTGRDFPLLADTRLSTRLATLYVQRSQDATLDFQGGGNAPECMLSGWSDPEPWGTWTDGPLAVLRFAPNEWMGGTSMEMTIDLHPFVDAAVGLTSQRVQARFNGQQLDEQRVTENSPPLTFVIPAAWWNAAVGNEDGVVLAFHLPDAASPAALDRTGKTDDTRLLGVGLSRISFHERP